MHPPDSSVPASFVQISNLLSDLELRDNSSARGEEIIAMMLRHFFEVSGDVAGARAPVSLLSERESLPPDYGMPREK